MEEAAIRISGYQEVDIGKSGYQVKSKGFFCLRFCYTGILHADILVN